MKQIHIRPICYSSINMSRPGLLRLTVLSPIWGVHAGHLPSAPWVNLPPNSDAFSVFSSSLFPSSPFLSFFFSSLFPSPFLPLPFFPGCFSPFSFLVSFSPRHRSRTPWIQLKGLRKGCALPHWGRAEAELQPKSNLVHFSFRIWHLLSTILTLIVSREFTDQITNRKWHRPCQTR